MLCADEWIAFSWKGRVDCLICRRWLCFFFFGAVRERRESWCRFLLHTGVRGQSWCRARAERLFLLLSDPVESCVMSEKC